VPDGEHRGAHDRVDRAEGERLEVALARRAAPPLVEVGEREGPRHLHLGDPDQRLVVVRRWGRVDHRARDLRRAPDVAQAHREGSAVLRVPIAVEGLGREHRELGRDVRVGQRERALDADVVVDPGEERGLRLRCAGIGGRDVAVRHAEIDRARVPYPRGKGADRGEGAGVVGVGCGDLHRRVVEDRRIEPSVLDDPLGCGRGGVVRAGEAVHVRSRRLDRVGQIHDDAVEQEPIAQSQEGELVALALAGAVRGVVVSRVDDRGSRGVAERVAHRRAAGALDVPAGPSSQKVSESLTELAVALCSVRTVAL
jgi:hypothetical protein